MGRDLYEILGVDRNASMNEIKRAYRRLTKQYHPDRNPNDPSAEQRFKEVQQAYEILGDKEKRSEYDRFGDAGVGRWETDPRGQRVYSWGSGSQVPFDDLEDLLSAFGAGASVFDEVFGGGRRRRTAGTRRPPGPVRGDDVVRTVNLSFEQAAYGTTVEVDIPGGGAGGRRRETLNVKIPPGVEHGKRIRLKGKGKPGRNSGPAGDLYLNCSVRPHAHFRRDGKDVYVDLPVTIFEATLGAKVEVPTLGGRVQVKIPPGTPGGTRLRLRGKGIAGTSGPPGDQYVVVRIVPPRNLCDEERKRLEELSRSLQGNPRKDLNW